MTQTTSPDNIPSPDLSDQYALTQDMANLASGVQLALNRRANTYTGTAIQRNSFTTAPSGALWQDTDGAKMLWRRDASSWVPAVWRHGGTAAQMTAFTQAPNGFEWVNSSDGRTYTRTAGAWAVNLGPWVTVSGWTGGFTNNATTPVQYSIIGDEIRFRGAAVNNTWSGGLTQFNTLPEAIRPATGFRHFPVAMNSSVVRTIYIRNDGALFFYGSGPTNATWSFDSVRYALG